MVGKADADPMEVLSNSWYYLRLSVRYPGRVPTWDAILLTAASPEQADLYEWHLKRAKRMERIAESTITMAVPDPQGSRIGSGAATLSALRSLADRIAENEPQVISGTDNDEKPYGSIIYNQLVKMRILLLHAGGDSKRVPWANPMGKVFLPLPYLAEEDPDGPVPLLFDHILAVSSCALQAFKDKGGLFIMTGDVLPCFDASTMVLPDDGACVVTVPITLDIAGNHGVIVVSSTEMDVHGTSHEKLHIVENLLQKPSLKELVNNGAIRSDGRALLDTGIFAIRGKAWQDIIELSISSLELIYELLACNKEVSLYEDLAGAWVSAKHEWLKTRPLGLKLVNSLGCQKLFTYCAHEVSKPLSRLPPKTCDENEPHNLVCQLFRLQRARVELPVRVDFVGGWSDTPPWSLERIGCVLNMAINLEGTLPIGAEIVVTSMTGISIHDDAGNQLHMEDARAITVPLHEEDPFRLVKAALLVTGLANPSNQLMLSSGLEISTWANVPRGSGLGTSSILAAAVVKGLLRVMGGDETNENVARLVLVLEQLMGTGGGWQDQIGGLYPGIKCTTSLPGKPLQLNVETVSASSQLVLELEQRMLVVFTGQVRLAHQVLQKVVIRYLQRDTVLITSIKRLAKLAKIGRESLMTGNVDDIGKIMIEAWRLHQELDPYCSNEFVDKLFKYVDPFCCGYKLVGAGGGGFALLLARNREAAEYLRDSLKASNFPVKVYNWNICLDGLSDLSWKL